MTCTVSNPAMLGDRLDGRARTPRPEARGREPGRSWRADERARPPGPLDRARSIARAAGSRFRDARTRGGRGRSARALRGHVARDPSPGMASLLANVHPSITSPPHGPARRDLGNAPPATHPARDVEVVLARDLGLLSILNLIGAPGALELLEGEDDIGRVRESVDVLRRHVGRDRSEASRRGHAGLDRLRREGLRAPRPSRIRSMIQGVGGDMRIESAEGRGTTVILGRDRDRDRDRD